jgi:PAS domain S-box-containing protein
MNGRSDHPLRPPTDRLLYSILREVSSDPGSVERVLGEREEPMLAFTADRRIVAANEGAEAFFGYGRHQLDGRSTDLIVPERFRQPNAPPQPATPDLTTVEIPGLHRDGRELPTSWTFGSVTVAGGPIFILLVRDLAQMALEIDALRRNDGRYRTLLLASAEVVWIASPDGDLLERLPAWERYTGQKWEEYRGAGWINAIHADDRDQVMHDWTAGMRSDADVHRMQGRLWSAQHRAWRAFVSRGGPARRADGSIVEWVGAITDVQDAVDAQERSRIRERELEGRFHTIYENALEGILLTDDALRIVDANPAACRILMRRREDIVGRSSTELMPPGDSAAAPERMDTFRSAGTLTGEGSILLPDGTIRRAEFSAVANVSPGIHLSIFRDVEDRRRGEEAQKFLDEASRVFGTSLDYDETLSSVARMAVPSIADWAAVDLLEPDGSFRRVALAHSDPTKVDLAKQLRTRQEPSLQDPSGVGLVVRTGKAELVELVTDEMLVAAMAEQPEMLSLVRGLGLKSAMTVPLSARGKVIGAISFIYAESRRRYSQTDLAFAQELSRRAGYAVENALFVRDLRLANRTKDVFLRRAEHLQATATRLVRADSIESIARAFESADSESPVSALAWSLYLRSGNHIRLIAATAAIRDSLRDWTSIPISADTPLAAVARTGNPVWFEDSDQMFSAFPTVPKNALGVGLGARVALPFGSGSEPIGVIGVMFETARTFAPDERAYLTAVANLWGQALRRAKLAEAEREASQRALAAETASTRKKDEFLAMLGHELRNPLAPIVTATALLRVRGRVTNRELDILDRQARHLARLIDDLLDISRITSGKLTLERGRVEVAEVIAQAIESTSPLFEEKDIRVFSDVAHPSVVVHGDRHRLVQVISNILVNSAKFTPGGRALFVTVTRDGGEAVVNIRDQGQGIEPDLLPRVFELFSQGRQAVDRRTGGLGLGLAIAHSIVVAHQGRIEISSPGTGQGTTVTIRLPVVAQADQGRGAVKEETAETTSLAAGRHRLLIVDDNNDNAQVLAEFLTDHGYDCYTAPDARTALSISREVLPDAAILDIGLPEMDGHQLARELRAALAAKAPKLIALTGYAREGDHKLAIESGFAEHLAKPVEMAKLTAALNGLLRR